MSDINIWNKIDFQSDKKKVLDYLNEQSKYLETSTSRILKMQVENVTAYIEEDSIKLVQLYILYIVSENLGGFRTKLITIVQNNSGPEFPVEVYSHVDDEKCQNVEENSFLNTLNEMLSTPSVQNVIVNLYKQSLPDNEEPNKLKYKSQILPPEI
ncbi:hypothetical protein [Myroides odoratus]|uniref:hypothetical protein n=1 Tax=Myroides odoratus TaxID=256 RepID=UPI003342C27D